MLVDAQYLINNKVLAVSYVDEEGDIKMKHFPWGNPTKYIACDNDDPERDLSYKSWDKKSVKKVSIGYPDRYAIYEYLDTQISESDREMIFGYNTPKIYFVDIETEILSEFPTAEEANTRVLSISVVYDDKIILMGLEDMPSDMQERIKKGTNDYFEKLNANYQFKYVKYDCEFDMLYAFFYKMVPKMSCITGWNFLQYDWLYLYNRASKVVKEVDGKELRINPAVSSFTKKMKKQFGSNVPLPEHRMIFDYMQLYEILDTSIKVKESSSLDYVSKKLVGVEKLKYTGSLQKLYDEDFETFMLYNAIDSVLVQRIHMARNYISIVYAISALAKIKVNDVISQMNNALGSLAITEGVLRNRFRDMENVVMFKDETNRVDVSGEESIAGGYVKDPVIGMNRHCAIFDFASLYPTSQRQWYISPETYVGISEDGITLDNGQKVDKNKHVICVNNCVFEKRMSPTLQMLSDVYVDRKTNKKKMLQINGEIDLLKQELKRYEAELEMIE